MRAIYIYIYLFFIVVFDTIAALEHKKKKKENVLFCIYERIDIYVLSLITTTKITPS